MVLNQLGTALGEHFGGNAEHTLLGLELGIAQRAEYDGPGSFNPLDPDLIGVVDAPARADLLGMIPRLQGPSDHTPIGPLVHANQPPGIRETGRKPGERFAAGIPQHEQQARPL